MINFTTIVASAQLQPCMAYPTTSPSPFRVIFTLPQGLLYLLSSTPNSDQLLRHRRLFKVVLNTERHLPHGASQSVMPCELVVQHSVNSLVNSLGLTIKSMQANILVLSSKAQARYGVWCTSGTTKVRILSAHWCRKSFLCCVADWKFIWCIRQYPDDPNRHPNTHKMSLRLMSRFVSISKV